MRSSSFCRTLHTASSFATLLGYAELLSAIPRSDECGYGGMVAELRALFDEYQRDGMLVTSLACQLYLGRLRTEYMSMGDG